MQCPECNSTHIRKNGKRRGKQNHICVDCDAYWLVLREFVQNRETNRGYSDEIKENVSKCMSTVWAFEE